MIITEYNEEWDNAAKRKYYIEKGFKIGFEIGFEIGRVKEKLSLLKNLLAVKTPIEFIVKATGWSEEKILSFAENDSVTYELERKAGEDVGEYTISVSDGASATTYTGGVTKYNITTGEAIFKITPKSIIVTADDLSKIYGEEDPELTVTIEGLVVAGEEGNTSDTGEGTSETGEGTPTQEESDPTPNPAPDAEDTEAPESTETAEQTDSTGLITFTITREPGENVGEYEITVTGEE
ncbi:MAG: hypothetical protein IKN27_04570, partial [Selenomonadaceae bacterium]|nr:hypothetical protein [Selenomonadaceae bacterium]